MKIAENVPFGGSEKSLLVNLQLEPFWLMRWVMKRAKLWPPSSVRGPCPKHHLEPVTSADVRAPTIISNLDSTPPSGVRDAVRLNTLFEWLTTLLVKNFTSFQVWIFPGPGAKYYPSWFLFLLDDRILSSENVSHTGICKWWVSHLSEAAGTLCLCHVCNSIRWLHSFTGRRLTDGAKIPQGSLHAGTGLSFGSWVANGWRTGCPGRVNMCFPCMLLLQEHPLLSTRDRTLG